MENKTKVLVHSSSNPHYVENADSSIAEKSFTNRDTCKLVTNPHNHNDLIIEKPGKKVVRFVKTCDLSGDIRRIAD